MNVTAHNYDLFENGEAAAAAISTKEEEEREKKNKYARSIAYKHAFGMHKSSYNLQTVFSLRFSLFFFHYTSEWVLKDYVYVYFVCAKFDGLAFIIISLEFLAERCEYDGTSFLLMMLLILLYPLPLPFISLHFSSRAIQMESIFAHSTHTMDTFSFELCQRFSAISIINTCTLEWTKNIIF